MLKLLHRHIFKELLAIFGLAVGCLLGLILIGRLLQLREMLLGQSLGVIDLALIFLYLTPFFLVLLLPIACMLSVFLTFLRMSTDKELTALKAGGVSLYQLLPAPLAFGLVCACLGLVCSFWGLSWGMDNFRRTLVDFVQTRTRLALQAGTFNRDFLGLTFYAHQVDNDTGRLKFVFVQDKTRKDVTVAIVAPEATIRTEPDEGRLAVDFKNGRIFRRVGQQLDILHFGAYSLRLPLASLLTGMRTGDSRPSEMSFAKLLALRDAPPDSPEAVRFPRKKVVVELHKRLALPLACLVLGLFALPTACVFRGLKSQYGLVLSLGLFLVYYSLFSLGVSLAEAGTLPPVLALWSPNILFLGVGGGFLWLAQHERAGQFVERLAHLRLRRRTA
ncbi:MAG TPA: LPS export ABC transporter permease LptF [Desulfovibrio sp.]|uniref:LPS export ABC transporter permease LptF n=1 Tax=Desulfovibrio TaxID=872 RepID=UPI000422C976|nr:MULTISPECIES: LPS export ABC transporter permease LptF [Desulfovibrio]MDY0307729.1 LPS export ABC transporter permease LptF [Desulfovibrionaceae bacterium]HMM38585.1 LPS export ABC transporter permease LptF [Desulfovibrio sp.]